MAMTETESLSPSRRRPGWYIPYYFFGFFAVIIAVNAVMIYFALSSWTGISTRDHYRKGLAYNTVLNGVRAQEARGWQVKLDFAAAGGRQGELAVTFKDRDGRPLTEGVLTATFIRPTNEGQDRTVPLNHQGEGRYAAPVALALAGVWDVRVVGRLGSEDWQSQQRIWVKE